MNTNTTNQTHADKVAAIKALCEQSRLSPSSRFYMDAMAKNAAEQGITLDQLEFAMGELNAEDIQAFAAISEEEQAVALAYFEGTPATMADREAAPLLTAEKAVEAFKYVPFGYWYEMEVETVTQLPSFEALQLQVQCLARSKDSKVLEAMLTAALAAKSEA